MFAWFRRRYLDLLGSIYIYNEHRGYTSIDRILEAVRAHAPDDRDFIAAVEKHRADERKHYVMFKRWFELQGKMPLKVDRTCGHIDRFVEIMFRRRIDDLDTDAVMTDARQFERLCRVISLTERRGMKQVDILLKHPLVKHDRTLIRIFRVIEKDEPSHWAPYDELDQGAWRTRAEMVGEGDRHLHPFGIAVPEAALPVLQPVPQAPHGLGRRARSGGTARLSHSGCGLRVSACCGSS